MSYGQRDLVKIGSQIVEDTGSEIRVSYQIDSSFLPEELWFTLDTIYRELISESSDAALIALLVPIMSRNSDIEVLGNLST